MVRLYVDYRHVLIRHLPFLRASLPSSRQRRLFFNYHMPTLVLVEFLLFIRHRKRRRNFDAKSAGKGVNVHNSQLQVDLNDCQSTISKAKCAMKWHALVNQEDDHLAENWLKKNASLSTRPTNSAHLLSMITIQVAMASSTSHRQTALFFYLQLQLFLLL